MGIERSRQWIEEKDEDEDESWGGGRLGVYQEKTGRRKWYDTHSFVTSRLCVGNTLLYRLPLEQIQRLQKVQNWTAHLIDGAMKYSHATPLLMMSHKLPIAVRVEFQILLLTHRALTGHSSGYIEQCVSQCQSVRSLRSSEHNLLCVPRTRRQWGDRAVSVAAPTLWNALPQHLTLTMTTAAFKVKLKT